FRIQGFVSSPGFGRTSADRQFFYVNKRPTDFPKMKKLIAYVYHMFSRDECPVIVLDVLVLKGHVDPNVMPDKTTSFIENEDLLLATVKFSLIEMFQGSSCIGSVGHSSSDTPSPSSERTLERNADSISVESSVSDIDVLPKPLTSSLLPDGKDDSLMCLTLDTPAPKEVGPSDFYYPTIAPSQNEAAVQELEQNFRKEAFNEMEVVGQFNLGFIIGKVRHSLFIIDQHASDEKYNYERFLYSAAIQSQRLMYPIQLNLMPAEISVVLDNQWVFEKNGIELDVVQADASKVTVHLKALPVCHEITFNAAGIFSACVCVCVCVYDPVILKEMPSFRFNNAVCIVELISQEWNIG
ncbi:unnamed protein product, partial [Soboliphyme baturini]|uniref:MutL_C domain-containing protein n=1 Tax=Soboliphyme baturini TaxID=241478 RepID=A0A183IK29_9BILA